MLVHMPYVYDAVVLERRCRNISHSYFGGWHAVEVDEVSGDDAPVAMRWTVPGRNGGEDTPYETRWHAERHWMPFGRPGNPTCELTPAAVLLDEKAWFAPVKAALGYNPHQNAALEDFVAGKLRPLDDEHVNEIHFIDRETGVRSTEEAAGRLLSVDRVLYVPVNEPCYRLHWRDDMWGGEQRPSAWISADMPTPYQRMNVNGLYFRADRLEDMIAVFRQSRRQHVFRSRVEIEVLLPHSVNYEDDRDGVRCAARRLIGKRWDGFDGVFDQLRTMDADCAASWFRLRDALAAWDGTEEATEALAMHMEKLADGLKDGQFREQATFALARWQARPLADNSMRP